MEKKEVLKTPLHDWHVRHGARRFGIRPGADQEDARPGGRKGQDARRRCGSRPKEAAPCGQPFRHRDPPAGCRGGYRKARSQDRDSQERPITRDGWWHPGQQHKQYQHHMQK